MRPRPTAEVADEASGSGAEAGAEVHAVSVGTPAVSSAPASASEMTPPARLRSCKREDELAERAVRLNNHRKGGEARLEGADHSRTGSPRPPVELMRKVQVR